jgi:dihydrofolate reductase
LKHDLVDELQLKIVPITLGKGKRLFEEGILPLAFSLESSEISPNGVIYVTFIRAGEVKTGVF